MYSIKYRSQTLLRHCDMVINHGGINTIVECIMAEKPMVVFPLSLQWDQTWVCSQSSALPTWCKRHYQKRHL